MTMDYDPRALDAWLTRGDRDDEELCMECEAPYPHRGYQDVGLCPACLERGRKANTPEP